MRASAVSKKARVCLRVFFEGLHVATVPSCFADELCAALFSLAFMSELVLANFAVQIFLISGSAVTSGF